MTDTLLVPPNLESMAIAVLNRKATHSISRPDFEVVVLRAMPAHQFVLIDSAEIEKRVFQVRERDDRQFVLRKR